MDVLLGVVLLIALIWATAATKAYSDEKISSSYAWRQAQTAKRSLAKYQADDLRLLKLLLKDTKAQADLITRSDYE